MLGLSGNEKFRHGSCIFNKLVRTFFVWGVNTGAGVVIARVVLSIFVLVGCVDEAVAVDKPEIVGENRNINRNLFDYSVLYLVTEFPVSFSGKFVEFFSTVSPQGEPMPKQKPEKESKEGHDYGCVIEYVIEHWLSLVLWFLAGMWCSGYFTERWREKSNVK